MMLLNHLPLLLAQADSATAAAPGQPRQQAEILRDISGNLSSEGLISTHWLFIAAGVVFVLLSTVSIVQWWKHRHERSHPWLIFATTARIAGLGLRHQWSLFLIARQQKLASPLTLMLAPGTFDHHVKAYLDTRPNWRREGLRRKTQETREMLFGNLVMEQGQSQATAQTA